MEKFVKVLIVVILVIAAFFVGARFVNVDVMETDIVQEGSATSTDLVKVDKQLISNGQKVNVDGYVIDGNEYYRLKDLEHTLGFEMKTDETKKTIELVSSGEIKINNFNPSDFKEYDLKIVYPEDKVDIQYDRGQSMIYAKYSQKQSGKNLKGKDAELIIENKLLTIDYKAGEDDIVNTILKNLGLENNYKELELEIEFADGTEFQIEQTK